MALSQALPIDNAAIRRWLDRLEQPGFFIRIRGKQDRRRIKIVLTQQGE
ncbi:MarR family transcriptional regulator [Gilliamella sp. wkB178]|nr:MarR family transcriptional regulator [Gilliamella apicola]